MLRLVHKVVAYGRHLTVSLHRQVTVAETPFLERSFGISDPLAILVRIAVGLRRAVLLVERTTRAAGRIEPSPEPAPSRAPGALRVSPASPRRTAPQSTDTAATAAAIKRLPANDQITARVRREPIGVVLSDICRDLGIMRGHPLWDELYAAITEFRGRFLGLFRSQLNRHCPIAHIVARLEAGPEAEPEPAGTGLPLS